MNNEGRRGLHAVADGRNLKWFLLWKKMLSGFDEGYIWNRRNVV